VKQRTPPLLQRKEERNIKNKDLPKELKQRTLHLLRQHMSA
jgi:hypothetical protein